MLATVFDQVLGMLCMGVFTVMFLISVAVILATRFLKRNDEARKLAKGLTRAAVFKAAKKWLK